MLTTIKYQLGAETLGFHLRTSCLDGALYDQQSLPGKYYPLALSPYTLSDDIQLALRKALKGPRDVN